MITRIEIDGYKSFVDFALDVPQLLVLVGANNGGKSNLLQALDLFQDLQLGGSALAFGRIERDTAIFHRDVEGREVPQCKIVVSSITGTSALPVESGVIIPRNAGRPTGSKMSGARVEKAEEWSFVDLVPSAMRQGAPRGLVTGLARDGSNVASLVAAMSGADPEGFSELTMDLAAVLPGFAGLEPVYDRRREVSDLDFVFDSGRRLPCSMVSDGTLRVLGILAALHVPGDSRTLLIDEIEIGMHPAFLRALVARVMERLADRPDRQLITTTHSPVVVSQVLSERPGSVVFFDQVYGTVGLDDGIVAPTERTRARPVAAVGERGHYVTPREVRHYLETVQPVDLE